MLFSLSVIGCEHRLPGPEVLHDGVSFSFYAPNAQSVSIAGCFNAWDIKRDILSGPDKSGFWNVVLPLDQGRYEYLFVVDGNAWQPDPSVTAVDDGFGGKNSVLFVPGGR